METKQLAWHWILRSAEDAGPPTDAAEQRFGSRSDAETWLGESWPDLWDAGVREAVLLADDRQVGEPLALRPGPAERGSGGQGDAEPVPH